MPKTAKGYRPTRKATPRAWERHARMYRPTGEPGIHCGKAHGEDRGRVVELWHLIYYDDNGRLAGAGIRWPNNTLTLTVAPSHRRQGIASKLWGEAVRRWGVRFEDQEFTPEGARFAQGYDGR